MTTVDQLRCYDTNRPYLPEFRFGTPKGFRDEPYIVPFSFQVPTNGNPVFGLPISLDDDAPFIWRSIVFPMVGLTKAVMAAFPASGFPCLVRFWDTRGNALQKGLVLTAGAWCQSGFGNNGWGFPLDDEIECDPGGVVQLDIQAPLISSGGFAFLTALGTAESITFTAVTSGTAGNSIHIVFEIVGPSASLVIGVVGSTITIQLASDAGGESTSTFADVMAAMNGDVSASALVHTTIAGSNSAEVIQPGLLGERGALLAGGGGVSTVSGNLIGVKRFPDCIEVFA